MLLRNQTRRENGLHYYIYESLSKDISNEQSTLQYSSKRVDNSLFI